MSIRDEMDKLKELMLKEEVEFSDIFRKFMGLTGLSQFMDMGKPKKNKLLEAVIRKTVEEIHGTDIQAIRLIFIRQYQFYHGSFIADFLPGTVIYFADIKMGLISMSRDLDGDSSFLRFTDTEIREDGFISVKESKETH